MAMDLATERSDLVTGRFPTPNEPNRLKDDFEQTWKMKDSLFLLYIVTHISIRRKQVAINLSLSLRFSVETNLATKRSVLVYYL